MLYENGGTVRRILWFVYVRIDRQAGSLGGGGWQDPLNPAYMWAETMLQDDNLHEKSQSEIIALIEQTVGAHPEHSLVPSFYIE